MKNYILLDIPFWHKPSSNSTKCSVLLMLAKHSCLAKETRKIYSNYKVNDGSSSTIKTISQRMPWTMLAHNTCPSVCLSVRSFVFWSTAIKLWIPNNKKSVWALVLMQEISRHSIIITSTMWYLKLKFRFSQSHIRSWAVNPNHRICGL